MLGVPGSFSMARENPSLTNNNNNPTPAVKSNVGKLCLEDNLLLLDKKYMSLKNIKIENCVVG